MHTSQVVCSEKEKETLRDIKGEIEEVNVMIGDFNPQAEKKSGKDGREFEFSSVWLL